jgi:hypothetical protein
MMPIFGDAHLLFVITVSPFPRGFSDKDIDNNSNTVVTVFYNEPQWHRL